MPHERRSPSQPILMIIPDDKSSSHSTETPGSPEQQPHPQSPAEPGSPTSTMSDTTAAQATIDFEAINVTTALNKLLQSPWYVGNPNLPSMVKWLVAEKTFTLVRTDNEEEAEIEFMGQIDSKDGSFLLYVDGGWKPAFREFTPFANTKARGRLIQPERAKWEAVANIWNDQIAGFEALQNTKKTRGASIGNTLVDHEGHIRLRHIVFEDVRNKSRENNTDTDTDDDDLDENSPFHMKQWPCSTPEGRQELDSIIEKGELKGNVIPAYHMGDGDNLIEPIDYRKCLSGALVLVKAAITFQNIGSSTKQGENRKSRSEDSWYAEIREIRVISPPPPPPASPAKRRAKQAMRNNEKKIRQA